MKTKEILLALHDKFTANINSAAEKINSDTDETEVHCRAISIAGQKLKGEFANTEAQKIIAGLLSQVFADSISSIYLSGSGLLSPARILLRRSLELGVAVLYLWDLPHVFWDWRNKGEDLSFSAMLKHLGSDGYIAVVSNENSSFTDSALLDTSQCQELYSALSDVVHGKLHDESTDIENSFDFDEKSWQQHVGDVNQVATLLLDGLRKRFNGLGEELQKEIPALERIK